MSNTVPHGWKVEPLGSIASVNWGDTRLTKASYVPHGYPAYSASGFDGYLPDFQFNQGGMVLSAIGARCGRVFYATGKWTAIKNTITLFAKPDKSDIKFLYQYFGKPDAWEISGGAQPFIGLANARKLDVPTPPLPEQQKIASILSSVDDVIEKTRAQIDKLKDLKAGMMQELLTKGIGSGGVPHKEFKDSPVGRIPESWNIKPLAELSEKISDGIHTTPKYTDKSDYRFVNGNNLRNGQIYVGKSSKCVPESEYLKHRKNLTPNTILMSINGTIGNLAYYRGEKVVLGKSAAFISLKGDQPKEFIYFVLHSQSVKNFYDYELTGSTINNLSLRSIKDTPIPIPPKSEQKKIANILTDLDCRLDCGFQKMSRLSSLKKALMQDLLTGKVRVNVDQKESAVA